MHACEYVTNIPDNLIGGEPFLKLPTNDRLLTKLNLTAGGEDRIISKAEEV